MPKANPFLEAARKYEKPMVKFLRDMVAIPSESAQEGPVIARIRQEMESTGAFDKIWVDGLGNLLAQVGKPAKGKKLIAIDAHVDTVGVGNRDEWKHDPYKGKVADGKVWGRGAGDQEGAIPAMVYAAKILRDLKVDLSEFSLLLTCTVMEEDCDGLCWQYIVNEDKIRPDVVVVTDSTDCKILRGQRGRMEIGVTCLGKSCHGSMPEKGDNAVYKIAKVVREIEELNKRLPGDEFLGKGTITVSYIDCKTPSLCAVPGQAYIHLDRRLTVGDTKKSAVAEVKDAIKRAGVEAKVEVLRYARPSYTGLVYETEKYFPMWCEAEDSLPVRAAVKAHHEVLAKPPIVHRWTFSTNAVSIDGIYGIPCVGFGPAAESVAHTVNDSVPIEHLINCAAFYAGFGPAYCDLAAGRGNGKPLKIKRIKT
jgi:putative selenium metabolism hydrolase